MTLKICGIMLVTTKKEGNKMSAFDRIAGYNKQKEELMALAHIFKNRRKYELKGATLPKGIIFYGPAGTGKTLFSEVLAETSGLKRITISISDSASEKNICRRIRKAFLQGSKGNEPTMIFFDELDKFLPNDAEEYYTDGSKAILAQLLTLIDGMEKKNNIVFVATCNDYSSLSENLTRPGRFDKKIGLDLPDQATRVAILDMYMKASPAKFEMTAKSIAKLTGEFSPAALKTLVNDCILISDENNYISEKMIRAKVLEIRDEDLPTERSEQSYSVDAVRNLGAFVVARTYSNSDYVLTVEENKVCNGFLDAVINNAAYDFGDEERYCDEYDEDDEDEEKPKNDHYSLASKSDLLAAVTALLGGLAAEELIFNKIYANLDHSIDMADYLFLKMSANGMLGLDLTYKKYKDFPYSNKVIERLGEVIEKTKLECYEKAKVIVQKNESLIKKLIPILIKRKSIEKAECEELIEKLGGIVTA